MKRVRLFVAMLAVFAVAATTLAIAPVAPAANSSPGTCTADFTLITVRNLAKLLSVNTLADVQAIDKNGNGYVCYKQTGNGTAYNPHDDKL